jgi:hypothetical protein
MNAAKLLVPVDGSPSAARAIGLVAGYRGEPSGLAPVVLSVQAPLMRLWPDASLDAAVEGVLLEGGTRAAAARRTTRSSAPWR